MTEFDFATLEHRLRELAFLNSGVQLTLRDVRSVPPRETNLHYEGGLSAFVRYLDRSKTVLIDQPIMIRIERERHCRRGRDALERQLPRDDAVLYQQHPPTRWRHAPRRLSRGADANDPGLRALRRRQEGKGDDHRR